MINKIVNELIDNSNVSVEITGKVSEAFEQQNTKIRETETIFTALNHEIESVSTSIQGINSEVGGLNEHKSAIEEWIRLLQQQRQIQQVPEIHLRQ